VSYCDVTTKVVHVVLGSNITLSITKKRFAFVDDSDYILCVVNAFLGFHPLTTLRLSI